MISSQLAEKAVLSPADHDHFIAHGYVVVKHAVDPAAIVAAVTALEAGTTQGTVGGADYKPVKTDALNALASEKFGQALSELFGEPHKFGPGQAGSDMPRPHEPNATWSPGGGVHVDDDYPTLLPNGWAVGSFLFLTPVRPGGGAFVFCSGSPRRILQAAGRDPWAIKAFCSDAAIVGPWAEFQAEPGDLLLFHHLMGHSGSPNIKDPCTRHALLSRHHPSYRITPGVKPFEQMSTIEKANSARYRREWLGDDLALPVPAAGAAADRALSEGMLPVGAEGPLHERGTGLPPGVEMQTPGGSPMPRTGRDTASELLHQVVVYHDCCPHLFFVAADRPAVVRHACARNWVEWEPLTDVELPEAAGPITSLNLQMHPHQRRAMLAVGCGAAVQLVESTDLLRWSPLAKLPGVRLAQGFSTSPYGNVARVGGQILFEVMADAPGAVRRRVGPKWEEIAGWAQEAPAADAGDRAIVTAVEISPTLGEGEFALILESPLAGVGPGSRPAEVRYIISRDCLKFDGPAVPLAGPAGGFSQLRVLIRGRRYWIVSYLCQSRLFWGTIDWERKPIRVEPIDSVHALQQALAMVGLL